VIQNGAVRCVFPTYSPDFPLFLLPLFRMEQYGAFSPPFHLIFPSFFFLLSRNSESLSTRNNNIRIRIFILILINSGSEDFKKFYCINPRKKVLKSKKERYRYR
jgi:hypothetical protein